MVQPVEVDEFDVATAPRLGVQRRIEGWADQEEACVLGPGPESVSGVGEPIRVTTTDHLARQLGGPLGEAVATSDTAAVMGG